MVELLSRGAGWEPQTRGDAITLQSVGAGHRRRKIKAHTALRNQVIGQIDSVFPGLTGCWGDMLETKSGRLRGCSATRPPPC